MSTRLFTDIEAPFREASQTIYEAFAGLSDKDRTTLGKQIKKAFPAGRQDPPAPRNRFMYRLGCSLSRSQGWTPTACAKTTAVCVDDGYATELIAGFGTAEPWSSIANALRHAQAHEADADIFRRDPRRSCDTCWNHDSSETCPKQP